MGRRWVINEGKGKGQKENEKTSLFACLGEEEVGPGKTETPVNEVNYACRHINLANVLGGNDWERPQKNWEKECSIIIDTCFNG